jgi:hypothetical protein
MRKRQFFTDIYQVLKYWSEAQKMRPYANTHTHVYIHTVDGIVGWVLKIFLIEREQTRGWGSCLKELGRTNLN